MMHQEPAARASAQPLRKRRPAGPARRLWRSIRKPLANSGLTLPFLVNLVAFGLRFIYWTNRRVRGSDDTAAALNAHMPPIVALWHGQHLLAPCDRPRRIPVTAMFSRSADAELNARVAERLGFRTIRGSGGREKDRAASKGGARALIAMKKTLEHGNTVAMIADIPHGTPREAGLGIVTLARISGRPILPVAYATSRRKVLEKTWDRTTVNLPFGRLAVVFGTPIHVRDDADDAELETKRREVTESLNVATVRAYSLVDGAQ
jgi:lysophospholipid acyltransferase (LPLAT)-like uncharacterized protein